MTLPTRQPEPLPSIQAASDEGQFYHATLQDGTILWIPKNDDNADCVQVLAWAVEADIEL